MVINRGFFIDPGKLDINLFHGLLNDESGVFTKYHIKNIYLYWLLIIDEVKLTLEKGIFFAYRSDRI